MKLLTFLHRWLGVGLGLFFAMWFLSGMVMMYMPFPSLQENVRLTSLSDIDTKAITIPTDTVITACGKNEITALRVISIDARPAYICNYKSRKVKAVYADDGSRVPPRDQLSVRQQLEQTTNKPLKLITLVEYDQWTVHQKFDAQRPMYRVELADSDETHLYFSSITGELVQLTTDTQRFWNYLGAVVHWIYPTILRKHWVLWDTVVWWLSLFGILCAVIGVYLGVVHFKKIRHLRQGALSPFRGWMKWHHILGLFAGFIVVSWIVSGWLSMDHGRLFSTPNPTTEQVKAIQGGSFGEVSSKTSFEDLPEYPTLREIKIHAFGGEPIILLSSKDETIKTPVLEPSRVSAVVSSAFPKANIEKWSIVPPGDTYTALREGTLPPGTIRVELSDKDETWLHIDSRSGEILSVIDRSRRLYRWLYNGLHSLDIPGLANRRPLWDIVMLVLLLAGFITSSTGVVIGMKRALSLRSK